MELMPNTSISGMQQAASLYGAAVGSLLDPCFERGCYCKEAATRLHVLTCICVCCCRVLYKGVWSDKVEAIAEDFITLENDGKTMVDKQCLIEMHHQQRAHQYIVGDYLPAPPPGHV